MLNTTPLRFRWIMEWQKDNWAYLPEVEHMNSYFCQQYPNVRIDFSALSEWVLKNYVVKYYQKDYAS